MGFFTGTGSIFKPFKITDAESDSFRKECKPFSVSLESLPVLPLRQFWDDVSMVGL